MKNTLLEKIILIFFTFLKRVFQISIFMFMSIYLTLFFYNRNNLPYVNNGNNTYFMQNPIYDYQLNQKTKMKTWDFFSFPEYESASSKNKVKVFKIILDDDKHIVHLKITFAYDKKNALLKKELDERAFEIQDEIFRLISSKTIKEINSSKEREIYLKKEILNTSNLKIMNGKLEDIFITDFFISKVN